MAEQRARAARSLFTRQRPDFFDEENLAPAGAGTPVARPVPSRGLEAFVLQERILPRPTAAQTFVIFEDPSTLMDDESYVQDEDSLDLSTDISMVNASQGRDFTPIYKFDQRLIYKRWLVQSFRDTDGVYSRMQPTELLPARARYVMYEYTVELVAGGGATYDRFVFVFRAAYHAEGNFMRRTTSEVRFGATMRRTQGIVYFVFDNGMHLQMRAVVRARIGVGGHPKQTEYRFMLLTTFDYSVVFLLSHLERDANAFAWASQFLPANRRLGNSPAFPLEVDESDYFRVVRYTRAEQEEMARRAVLRNMR